MTATGASLLAGGGVEIAMASLVVAAAACVQGVLGFGFSLIAAPLLVLLQPRLVPGPVLALLLLLTVLMTLRERGEADRRGVAWALCGRLPGAVLGTLALALLPARLLSVAFALLVLLGVALSALGLRLEPRPTTILGAGVLSGVMETTSSIGGPPLALVYRDQPPPVARGTMSAVFVVGVTVSLTGVALAGRFRSEELWSTAFLVAPVLAGLLASGVLAPRIARRHLSAGVLVVATLSSLTVLVRAAAGP